MFQGAYFFSAASKIVGLEMNSDLCRVQLQIVDRFSLNDRIAINEAELTSRPDLVASSDVLVMMNVAEWFVPSPEFRVAMWQFVRQHLRPGSLLVTNPDLETTFENLGVRWS